jgi:hypothetical protein
MFAAGQPLPSEWKSEGTPVLVTRGFRFIEAVAQSPDVRMADPHVELGKSFREFRQQSKKRAVSDFACRDSVERADWTILTLSRFLEASGQATEKAMHRWQRLWSNLVVDQAPWDPSRNAAGDVRAHWKRANVACYCYCPFLLTRNFHFTNHMAASITRDIGNVRSAEEHLREYDEQVVAERRASAPPEILQVGAARQVQRDLQYSKDAGRLIAEFHCERVKIRRTQTGTCQIFKGAIRVVLGRPRKVCLIRYDRLIRVLTRRMYHLSTGLEFFLVSGRSCFLNFPDTNVQDVLRTLNLTEAQRVQKQDFPVFIQSLSYTQQWATGEISNFKYLCHLNILGGRSFNDASQYPIFPWVIADYESTSLDLSQPSTFRDLEKPMGALNPARLAELRSRMAAMQQTSKTRPYLYSSFAMCSLAVYFYFLRVEPFATLHIEMQSGKFDHASRLFLNVADSYHQASTHLSDYRELTPEFYFQPEFLLNENEFDLGSTPQMGRVGHVVLPPWAQGSAPLFIYLMRRALESDYVSEHLADWIDLLFGYKQTDQPAVDAANMYHPDMYETAWTKQTLNDPARRAEIQAVMKHVGTIPAKLFSHPHPRRVVPKPTSVLDAPVSLDTGITNVELVSWNLEDLDGVVILANREITVFAVAIQPVPSVSKYSSILLDQDMRMLQPFHAAYAIAVTDSGGLVVIEHSRMAVRWPELRDVSSIATHGRYTAIVSDAATLNLFGPFLKFGIPFYGEPISCCAISPIFRIAVAGTFSGSLLFCSLLDGTKMRVINLGSEARVVRICITQSWGFVVSNAVKVVEGKIVHSIWVHNCNGMLIRTLDLDFLVTDWTPLTSKTGFDYVVIVSDGKRLYLAEVFYLNVVEPFHRCPDKVVSLNYRIDVGVVLVVLQTGILQLVPLPI